MTTESAAGGLAYRAAPVNLTQILDLCDGILAELGRRNHRFAWLRAPDAGLEDWLEVDAYYPGNRLVVVWRERPGPHDHLYSELVPARGLRLLELAPSDLDGDAQAALRAMITALGPALRPATAPQARRFAHSQPAATAHAGVALGLLLTAAVLVELFLSVTIGLDAGRLVLAFGLSLDACARALGTIAAGRASAADWAWWCALGGSPFVARFALFGSEGPVSAEPAPLAGLLSMVAMLALAVALLAAVI